VKKGIKYREKLFVEAKASWVDLTEGELEKIVGELYDSD
jgi:hypothetical protein